MRLLLVIIDVLEVLLVEQSIVLIIAHQSNFPVVSLNKGGGNDMPDQIPSINNQFPLFSPGNMPGFVSQQMRPNLPGIIFVN